MYFQYCGIAFAVIALIYLAVYLYMRHKNLANRENIINLTGCTVLAMFCSAMSPYLARQLAHKLYFPVIGAIFISWIILAVFIGSVFLIIKEYIESKGRSGAVPDAAQLEASKEEAHGKTNDELQGASWIEIVASQDLEHNTEVITENNDQTEYYNEIQNELIEEPEQIGQTAATESMELLEQLEPVDHKEQLEPVELELVEHKEQPEPIETLEQIEAIEDNVQTESTGSIESFAEAYEEAAVSLAAETYEELTLEELVDNALDYKDKGDYKGAISMYEKAICKNPDTRLLELIVIDLCSLYKLTNQKSLAIKTLEKIDKNLLNPEIIDILQQNL